MNGLPLEPRRCLTCGVLRSIEKFVYAKRRRNRWEWYCWDHHRPHKDARTGKEFNHIERLYLGGHHWSVIVHGKKASEIRRYDEKTLAKGSGRYNKEWRRTFVVTYYLPQPTKREYPRIRDAMADIRLMHEYRCCSGCHSLADYGQQLKPAPHTTEIYCDKCLKEYFDYPKPTACQSVLGIPPVFGIAQSRFHYSTLG